MDPQVSNTVQPFLLEIIVLAKAMIIPIMLCMFVAAWVLRALIFFTVSREDAFAKEFEKRVNRFLLADDPKASHSFYILSKRLLEKTFYEMFEVRSYMKRRKLDHVMEPSDRIFLIRQGMAILVRDCLKEFKYIKFDGTRPPLVEIVKSIFANNPCFTRVFGVLPVVAFNDFLNIVPGLFIVGGIFGTFLGIMQALPELGAMDIRDPESTKMVMDTFLAKIAFSMSTSTVGILLSVLTTVYNNFLSPERAFTKIVERFERNLYRVWSRCDNNRLPQEIPDFDEHRDPVEAIASLSLDKVIESAEMAQKTAREREDATTKATVPIPAAAVKPQVAAPPPGDSNAEKKAS